MAAAARARARSTARVQGQGDRALHEPLLRARARPSRPYVARVTPHSLAAVVSRYRYRRRADLRLRPRIDHTVGFDIANNEFTAYGAPAQRITFTSLRDIGRAVARLAILSTDTDTDTDADAAAAASVPDDVRIAGSTVTFEGVRDIVAHVRGVAPARIGTEDLRAKREALKLPDARVIEHIRCVALPCSFRICAQPVVG